MSKLTAGTPRARAIDPSLLDSGDTLAILADHVRSHRSRHGLDRVRSAWFGAIPLAPLFAGAPVELGKPGDTRFRHPDQRPDTLYIPDLPPFPFPARDEVAAALERHAWLIRAEFEAARSATVTSPSDGLASAGAWDTLPLMRGGRPIAETIARCPHTWRIVSRLPLLTGASGAVYFSVITPGTRIAPHFGPTNARWRYHLALQDAPGARIRVGDEWREWSTGRCLILDDSFEHEVVHAGDRPRIILLVDAWRPELTTAEREFLIGLYDRVRQERR